MSGFALFVAGHCLTLAVLAATIWAAGGLVGRRFADLEMPIGFRLALGLMAVGQMLLILGLVGQLRALPILALLLVIHLAAWRDWRNLWTPLSSLPRSLRIQAGAFAVLSLPVFTLTLYPPLGYDQGLYHLAYSRAFVGTGGMPFLPDLRFPVFPQLMEVFQAGVWILAGQVATQLVGFVALAACVVLLAAWTRGKIEGPGAEVGGRLAVAVLVGSPCAIYLATCGYVEPLLALFVMAAIYAGEKSWQVGRSEWAFLGGLFAGSATAIKYHGLFFLAAAGLMLLRREPGRVALRRLALFGAAALATGGPSYARIFFLTGNPLFPFYSKVFGGGPWANESMVSPQGIDRLKRASTLLWDLTFRREMTGHLPHYTPILFLALPMALWAIFKWPVLRRPALVALLFLLLAPTHGHYFVAILPFWAMVLGAGTARLASGRPRVNRWLAAASVILALGGPLYALHRIHRLGPPPSTEEGRDRLLSEQLPLYPAILFLNREASGERVLAAGINAARMTSYFSGALLGDLNGVESLPRVLERATERGSLASAMDEIGASWMLVEANETAWVDLAARDERLVLGYEDSNAKVWRLRR